MFYVLWDNKFLIRKIIKNIGVGFGFVFEFCNSKIFLVIYIIKWIFIKLNFFFVVCYDMKLDDIVDYLMI